MTLLATFKHISSKNADYGAAEAYLTFEHDEFTMKPTLDENGRLIPREDYRISSLNCGGDDFAVACMRANLRYEKNQKREDVKSHHYIISFDPRDGTDNGLTTDRAQELGEQFCKAHFPGHQALICTHPDGHNHSGNILIGAGMALTAAWSGAPALYPGVITRLEKVNRALQAVSGRAFRGSSLMDNGVQEAITIWLPEMQFSLIGIWMGQQTMWVS